MILSFIQLKRRLRVSPLVALALALYPVATDAQTFFTGINIENNNADGGQIFFASSGHITWAMDNFYGFLRFYTGTTERARWSATNGGLAFGKDYATSATPPEAGMIIQGNVGIGTRTLMQCGTPAGPQACRLSVNGPIGAREVVVTNTGWADYVFRPEHRLQPLSEVASFIRDKGHLPGIPSEKEVKANGVGLAQMQVKLLAKIEELTLHMIEMDRTNKKLEAHNEEVVSKLRTLEAALAGTAKKDFN